MSVVTKTKSPIFYSIKWSGLSEIGVKLISPVATMILARLLAPEAFGVLAVCTLITTFSEIIADAGFGKYIVQADFFDESHFYKSVKVAFGSHFTLAIVICIIIFLSSDFLAEKLGISGHGLVISVASLQLLLMSIVSPQLAILRRRLEYKKIFVSRIISTLCNFCITIPLALILKSYWALVIGVLSGHFVNAVVLSILAKWIPKIYFNLGLFKEMFNFSFWSLLEGLAHWVIFNFDIFIVSKFFSVYYVGLYKNCSHMLLSFFGIVTASMSPVLLSIFSRLKNDSDYDNLYFNLTKIFMCLVLPVSIGIFYARDFVTLVLFGDQWIEGAGIVGAWSLMIGVSIFTYNFPAEIFKSKGIPKVLFFYQIAFLILLIPICLWAANIDFWTFVYIRALAIVFQLLLFVLFAKHYLGWKMNDYFKSVKHVLLPISLLSLLVVAIDSISLTSFWLRPVIYVGILAIYVAYCIVFLRDELSTAIHQLRVKSVFNGVV